jgi:hypothetical protein
MNLLKKTLASAALAVGALGSAHAVPQTVSGVTWDPASPLDFSSFSIAIRQFINPTTGVASGYGFISTINGTGQSVFCASGCEVTFQYGGFTPVGGAALPGTPGQVINYTGGFVNVFADSTPEVTNPSDPTSLTSANTGDGSLWLALLGHNFAGSTLTGTTQGTGTQVSGLSGIGLLDVIGGAAAAYFNTNTQTDGADFRFSNSFTLFFPQNNVLDAAGTGNFFSDSIALVPEPGSLALLGIGLLGLAAGTRRNAKK